MRQSLRLLFFLTAITFLSGSVMAQEGSAKGRVPEHKAFDNASIGIEASTTGIGLSAATLSPCAEGSMCSPSRTATPTMISIRSWWRARKCPFPALD